MGKKNDPPDAPPDRLALMKAEVAFLEAKAAYYAGDIDAATYRDVKTAFGTLRRAARRAEGRD